MRGAIQQALRELNTRLVLAESIGQALDAVAGDQPAPWVHVYRVQVKAIQEASEALEELLCRLLRGDGGHAPHGDQCASYTDLVRGLDGALPGSPARPDQPVSLASE